jgi:hypothetical protein
MTPEEYERGIHLQWFRDYGEAVTHIDKYSAVLRRDRRFEGLNLTVSRPRQEAGGYALYAIPRPE